MPLIPCPECSALISDRARSCPVCGKPGPALGMAAEERIGWLVAFIVIALLALILQQ